jgi:hypothetical protein
MLQFVSVIVRGMFVTDFHGGFSVQTAFLHVISFQHVGV